MFQRQNTLSRQASSATCWPRGPERSSACFKGCHCCGYSESRSLDHGRYLKYQSKLAWRLSSGSRRALVFSPTNALFRSIGSASKLSLRPSNHRLWVASPYLGITWGYPTLPYRLRAAFDIRPLTPCSLPLEARCILQKFILVNHHRRTLQVTGIKSIQNRSN